jgi:YggT family protein
MFVFGNFLAALAHVMDVVLTLYMWIVIIAVLISWVNPDPYNPVVRFLRGATEPVLRPIRHRLPLAMGGLDFSPLIVILGILFLQRFLVASLLEMASRMR